MKKLAKSELKRLKKENKEFNKLFNTLRNTFRKDKDLIKLREERELREQTEQFWHLQLQFLEVTSLGLSLHFRQLVQYEIYSENKHTKKIRNYTSGLGICMTEEQRQCVATHLALQLSGLGDV
jgi:uncharacterized membrane protein (DUF106 family)